MLTAVAGWRRDALLVLAIIVLPVLAFVAAIELTDDDPSAAAADDGPNGDAIAAGEVLEAELAPGGRDEFALDAEGIVTITVDGDGAGFTLLVVDEARGERSVSDPSPENQSLLVVEATGDQTVVVEDAFGRGGDYTLSVVEGGEAEGPVMTIGPDGRRPVPLPLPPRGLPVPGPAGEQTATTVPEG